MKKVLGEVINVAFWLFIMALMNVITINPIEEWGPKLEKVETFGPVQQQDSIKLTPIFK